MLCSLAKLDRNLRNGLAGDQLEYEMSIVSHFHAMASLEIEAEIDRRTRHPCRYAGADGVGKDVWRREDEARQNDEKNRDRLEPRNINHDILSPAGRAAAQCFRLRSSSRPWPALR